MHYESAITQTESYVILWSSGYNQRTGKFTEGSATAAPKPSSAGSKSPRPASAWENCRRRTRGSS